MYSLHLKQSDRYTVLLYLYKVKYEESTYKDNKAMNSQTRDLFFFTLAFFSVKQRPEKYLQRPKKGIEDL